MVIGQGQNGPRWVPGDWKRNHTEWYDKPGYGENNCKTSIMKKEIPKFALLWLFIICISSTQRPATILSVPKTSLE